MSKLVKAVKIVAKHSKLKNMITILPDVLILRSYEYELQLGGQNLVSSETQYNSVAEFELYSSGVDDCIGLVTTRGTTHNANELCSALSYCGLAMDHYSSRYALNAVCWDKDILVASDGRRLHYSDSVGLLSYCDGSSYSTEHYRQVILPPIVVNVVPKLVKLYSDDILTCHSTDSHFVIGGDCWRLSVRLVEGRFPNWKAVVGQKEEYKECENVVFLKELREHCKNSIKATKLRNKVEKDKLPAKERKSYDDELPAVTIDSSKFNAQYILDAIDGIANATMKTYRKDSQLMIGNAVVMPISK